MSLLGLMGVDGRAWESVAVGEGGVVEGGSRRMAEERKGKEPKGREEKAEGEGKRKSR